jgi:hypothetical protein
VAYASDHQPSQRKTDAMRASTNVSAGRATEDDETYLDAPYLSIRWRAIPQILYAEWKGFATSAEFRSALLIGLRAIRERHVRGYVSDARKAKVVTPEDRKWVAEVWLPGAVAAGLQRMAMVTPETGLGKSIVEEIVKDVDQHGISMRKFDSVATATMWALTGLRDP